MSDKSLRDDVDRLKEAMKKKDALIYKALAAISDDPDFCRLRVMRILTEAYDYHE